MDVLTASRLISRIQRGDKKAKKIAAKLPSPSKDTLLIGVTGPGGVGKSTLIGRLIESFRKEGKTVGVIACDPASISGGTVLGDRIRMQQFADEEVFIRSLAQYENYKGVTPEVPFAIKILAALGKEVIIIETVGVGQKDLGFRELVDILIFVTAPGSGDEIQLLKGGAIQTADIIVINQASRPGAEITLRDVLMEYGDSKKIYKKKIYKIDSLAGEGIAELVEGIKEVKSGLRIKRRT